MTITGLPSAGGPTEELTRAALERGVGELLGRQLADGSWRQDRPPGAAAIAEDLLLNWALATGEADRLEYAASQLRALQLADGGWPASAGGEPDLAASVKAYAALRLAGDPPDAYQLALAAGWIRRAGGITSAGGATRLWLAIAGIWPLPGHPAVRPELSYLLTWVSPGKPAWRLANWISADRLPADWNIAEWSAADWYSAEYFWPEFTASIAVSSVALALAPLAVIRAISPRYPERFDLSELVPGRSGARSGGRSVPAADDYPDQYLAPGRGWLPGLAARPARAARLAALRHCAEQIIADQDPDGSWGQLPLVSALSLAALADLGYAKDSQALAAGLSWFARAAGPACQTSAASVDGGAVATGRALAVTALAVRALTEAGVSGGHPALVRATGWLAARDAQLDSGGWGGGAWSGNREWPVVAAAAGAVEALSAAGESGTRAARHGVVWLLRAQRADGAWPGPDGRADEVSTGLAVRALVTAGVVPGKRPLRSAVRWLAQRQRPDGGWNGGIASTAATLALMVAGGADEAVANGMRWIAGRLGASGTRPGTASGAPADQPIEIDVLCHQISALGRFRSDRVTGGWAVR